MCPKYCDCGFCGYDKSECEFLGDGSAFCSMFQCTVDDCRRFECISYEELYAEYYL